MAAGFDDPLPWFGVFVPAFDRTDGSRQQRHAHIVTALRLDDNERTFALIEFQKRWCDKQDRKVVGKFTYDLPGLVRYMLSRRNLGIPGAKPTACRAVRRKAAEIGRQGPAALDDVREALMEARRHPEMPARPRQESQDSQVAIVPIPMARASSANPTPPQPAPPALSPEVAAMFNRDADMLVRVARRRLAEGDLPLSEVVRRVAAAWAVERFGTDRMPQRRGQIP
jgi:hypothetical protein